METVKWEIWIWGSLWSILLTTRVFLCRNLEQQDAKCNHLLLAGVTWETSNNSPPGDRRPCLPLSFGYCALLSGPNPNQVPSPQSPALPSDFSERPGALPSCISSDPNLHFQLMPRLQSTRPGGHDISSQHIYSLTVWPWATYQPKCQSSVKFKELSHWVRLQWED